MEHICKLNHQKGSVSRYGESNENSYLMNPPRALFASPHVWSTDIFLQGRERQCSTFTHLLETANEKLQKQRAQKIEGKWKQEIDDILTFRL